MTNVYLMQDGYSKLHKIGHSKNPERREKTLLSQQPLTELHTYWTEQTEDVEKALHQLFADKRVRGEWFALNDNDVDLIFYFFSHAKRVDNVPVPERLQSFCRLQDVGAFRVRSFENVEVVKVVTTTVVEETQIDKRYSERSLKDMREMIMLVREQAKRETNPDQWQGFAQGIVWASGVD